MFNHGVGSIKSQGDFNLVLAAMANNPCSILYSPQMAGFFSLSRPNAGQPRTLQSSALFTDGSRRAYAASTSEDETGSSDFETDSEYTSSDVEADAKP